MDVQLRGILHRPRATAAQTAGQISAFSRQQVTGMDQMALAMNNIRDASSQNLAGVKQLNAAAESLKEPRNKLKQTTEKSGR